MSDIKELKSKYEKKIWKIRGTNQRIHVKELIYYNGIKKYKVAYQKGIDPTEYLHDLSEEELLDFLMSLEEIVKIPIIPRKIVNKEENQKAIKNTSMENNNIDMEIPKEDKINSLEQLSIRLYETMDAVINDTIKIEKAVAISKLAQVILNVEKQKVLFQKENK